MSEWDSSLESKLYDDHAWIGTDDSDIEYMAFAVVFDNRIDVERYRCSVDMDTNAADFIYDNERFILHTGYPIYGTDMLDAVLKENGWETDEVGWEFGFGAYQATVRRIS